MSQDILDVFHRRFEQAKEGRRRFDEKRDLIDRHSEPWRHRWQNDQAGESYRRSPHVHHILETMDANMVEPEPSFDVLPREATDETQARAVGAWLKYSMERDGWETKDERFIKCGNRYGLGVVKILWDYEENVRKVEQPRTMIDRLLRRPMQYAEESYTVRDDPTISNVDIRDFWWQPRANDLDECEWVFHRTYVPLRVLQQRAEEGVYENVDDLIGGGGTADQRVDTESGATDEDRRRVHQDGVEVIEMYDVVAQEVVTVANGRVLIRHIPFPFDHGELPFACYVPIPAEGRFEGISPVERLAALQESVWEMENDAAKAAALALNPTMIVDPALKGGTDFHIRSGGRIFARPDQIVQLQVNPNQHVGMAEVQKLLGYVQNVSGVSPYIAGADAAAYGIDQKTATGVNQLAGAAGRRIGFHIKKHQEAVKRIGRQVVKLAYQFLDTERLVRIVGRNGEEFYRLGPDEIPADFDLRVRGTTESITKQMLRSQSIELAQFFSQYQGMPTADGRQIEVSGILRRVAETYDIDPDILFVDMTPQNQMMQQAGAEQAMNEAEAASPEAQMQMEEHKATLSDWNGDGVEDTDHNIHQQANFRDLPPDAKAAWLERAGLPSDGVRRDEQLDAMEKMAKIAQMRAQAQQTNAE